MTIVKKEKVNGLHPIKTNHLKTAPDDWLAVPSNLEDAIWATCGYCDLVIEKGVLVGIVPTEKPTPDLSIFKSTRIIATKTALEAYLAEHPLLWSDGKHYSVTAEKQALLGNALAVYQIGVQAGQAAELTWNATTEECTEWAFADLCALALAIAVYVKPLVAHQQALEVMIRSAETAEEVEGIVIDYAAAG